MSGFSSASTSTSPPLHSSTAFEPPFFDISYKSVSLKSQLQYAGPESDLENKIQKRITAFMNISEDDYNMVFTANQSSAFKLLADSYPFQSHRNLLTVYDYENEAVKVMIESSEKKGAQSRMTGARYSYFWMSMAQENGWHVLLDATALGPKDMETLGLSLFKPDFLICSFFKVFGENPSGFGCLFVKKSSISVLKDSTISPSIGIVRLVPATRPSQQSEEPSTADIETESKANLELSSADVLPGSSSDPILSQHVSRKTSELHEIEEIDVKQKAPETEELLAPSESTQFKMIESSISWNPELEYRGLDHADSLGLILISARARYLINWLVNALMSLQHPHSENGQPPISIYGPKIKFERGPAVAFNVFDWKGDKIDPALVQKLADRNNISLSYGFLHKIWLPDKHEEERRWTLETRTSGGGSILNEKRDKPHSGISVVTAALGFLTNFEDVYRLWAFVSRFLDADFVEKERWRYTALNQKIIEV
ncbi:hypothetical protein GH714_001930 [Hevea brasiliensis]|uniref:Aminotransferase class V domain-containing protein n=1 Tax=Hevea brasiliensis TaxID=3981 RepID=A0A6A6L894_HEVBR|nr:hypothetical protein GH714_001930 [Hevea brasiliensis]